MGDLLRLLLMAILFALGAWTHLEFEARSIRAARVAVLVLLSLWVLLFVTGLTMRSAASHRFLAHVFGGAAWVLLPFAVGISVADGVESRDWSRALHVGALVLALGATVAASNTGYLGRLSDRTVDVLRFRAIHQILTPGALAAALVAWLRLNRTSE
jgi:hypothetical protein